jgi:hypothetical protein
VGSKFETCTDNGRYSGLFQWGGERRQRLFVKYGQKWCDLHSQLEFMMIELREMGMLESLFQSRNLDHAASLMARFESGGGDAKRLAFAKHYYQQVIKLTKPTKPAIVWAWID